MFNVLIDHDLRSPTFGPFSVNCIDKVMASGVDVNLWQKVSIHDWRRACIEFDHYYYLNPEIKQWLNVVCADEWRYWSGTVRGVRMIVFYFKDPQLAMLFKLTWC